MTRAARDEFDGEPAESTLEGKSTMDDKTTRDDESTLEDKSTRQIIPVVELSVLSSFALGDKSKLHARSFRRILPVVERSFVPPVAALASVLSSSSLSSVDMKQNKNSFSSFSSCVSSEMLSMHEAYLLSPTNAPVPVVRPLPLVGNATTVKSLAYWLDQKRMMDTNFRKCYHNDSDDNGDK